MEISSKTIPRRQGVILAALIIATRVPLLPLGYGSDSDAWRVAATASRLWNDGIYHPSRFPGFPLYEVLNAPMVALGGPLLCNSVTLVFFILSVFTFWKIVVLHNLQIGRLLVWTFAFLPILWKNSANT